MKRIPKKKIHLFFTKAHIIGYNLNKYYLCNVICMHESAYTRLYNALNRSSCESHLALKIIMRTTDQWKKKKKTNTKKRKKKRRKRWYKNKRRKNEEVYLWFRTSHLAPFVGESHQKGSLVVHHDLRKAASRWPADVYHLILIVGPDEAIRERWVSVSGLIARLSLFNVYPRLAAGRKTIEEL